jgi:hypothetical protein
MMRIVIGRGRTPIRRMSRRFSVIFGKITPGGGGKDGGGRGSQEVGIVEHRENGRGRGSWGTVGTGSEGLKSPREVP